MMKNDRAYAPFWTRLLAHNIDLILFIPTGYGFSTFITSDMMLYGILACLYVLYNTALEATSWKGSLGKRLLAVKVEGVNDYGTTWWRGLLRNSLKFLSLALLFTGFLMIRFSAKRQGLHDRLSGSVVISS